MKGHGSAGEGRWGEETGESGVRGNCGRDVIYERRIKKERKEMSARRLN